MAARLWQGVLAGEVAFAASAAWLLAMLLALSAPVAVAIALAILGALQWLPATAAWLIAGVLARSQSPEDSEPKRARFAWAALRSVATEGVALARAQLAMSAAPLRRTPRLGPASGSRRPRPVLLIHGVLCNAAVWRALLRRLDQAGFGPVRALDLEPLSADIEYHASRVAHELITMQRECGGAQVAIVAHSRGGLVARAAVRMMGTRDAAAADGSPPAARLAAVSRIVTLATPHHGTAMAALLRSKAMRQMLPGSPWLRGLNDRSAMNGPAAAPITSIYSLDDELVVPPSSARLEGACNAELCGVGHLGMLTSRQASEAILRALAGDCL